jgi:KUP system potassium uptake protein
MSPRGSEAGDGQPLPREPGSGNGADARPGTPPGREAAVATTRPDSVPPAPGAPGATPAALARAALGIVYGDIGTSPLYAFRECLAGTHGVHATSANVHGILSLIFWALVGVVSLKYLTLVMRADNRGEGGILALMALARPRRTGRTTLDTLLVLLGLFGASLLYGDGMITPAISVLSAVEGLGVATPAFEPYVVPVTVVIVVALFVIQRHGTSRVGAVFGPVMLVWFAVLAALGLRAIVAHPQVLLAVNPAFAWRFFATNGTRAVIVLGAVFLVVTGAETLYADIGHFGRGPIRRAWFAVVFPGLLLNYFGQGALLLGQPEAAVNPFYRLAPAWALYPLVALATAATIIASQAVISGAFSLTHQAIQLGFLPRMRIQYTSEEEIGQIYVPAVNRALLVAVLALVVGFGSSTRLAGAYGVAVTTTMVITTALAYVVMRRSWGWPAPWPELIAAALLVMDGAFLAGNIAKIPSGGWVPLAVGLFGYATMSTWRWGRSRVAARLRAASMPFEELMHSIEKSPPADVPGTAVFLTGNPQSTPSIFVHNLKHNKVLHRLVIFLTIVTEEVPRIPTEERVAIERMGEGERFYRVTAHYGFMQDPHLPAVLARCHKEGLPIDLEDTSVFLAREVPLVMHPASPWHWRKKLYAVLAQNASSPVVAFRIRPEWVVEVRTRTEI